ncbi:MAG: hypothetical protein ABI645_08505 [Pseudomonadota bacterium]
MRRKQWWVALALLLAVGAMRSAGGAGYWRRYATALFAGGAESRANLVRPRLKLPGAAAEPPRATAESELIATDALQLAARAAQQQGAKGLLVHRHGHRVFEYFAAGRSGDTEVAGGELSAALLALALGVLVDSRRIEPAAAIEAMRDAAGPDEPWRNPWSAAAHRRFNLKAPPAVLSQDLDGSIANTISTRVWQPLGAADAGLWGVDDASLRLDCCVVARLADWMRLADLFLQQGNYQGQRIASPDWIRQLLAADAQGQRHPVWLDKQSPWTGDEPPAARDIYWFDLGTDLRLWLVPRRSLAILHWTDSDKARDTLVLNIILRGLQDQLPAGGMNELNDLVPGHP